MHTRLYWQQYFYDLQIAFGQKSVSENRILAIHEKLRYGKANCEVLVR